MRLGNVLDIELLILSIILLPSCLLSLPEHWLCKDRESCIWRRGSGREWL